MTTRCNSTYQHCMAKPRLTMHHRKLSYSPQNLTFFWLCYALLQDLDLPIVQKPVNSNGQGCSLDAWLLDASNAAYTETMQRIGTIQAVVNATSDGKPMLEAMVGDGAAAGPVMSMESPIKVGNRHPEAPQVRSHSSHTQSMCDNNNMRS